MVALIEPHPGQARAFNRWYELDHFYAAAMAGPGAFSGARWVAPRGCKARRPPGTLFGPPAVGSYLATYWILEGMQSEWDAWVGDQMDTLTRAGRLFSGRDHLFTAVYRPRWESRAPAGPPIEVALDRGFAGVVAVAFPCDPHGDLAAIQQWSDRLVGPEIPVCLALAPERLIASVAAAARPDVDRHVLVLAFCDVDPIRLWGARVGPSLERVASELGVAGVGFASPFVHTVPGTDAWVDDL